MSGHLILVGASVRAASGSALRAGFKPYAIDQFADRDLAAVCPAVRIARYPHDFLAALRDAPQGAWIYTGGLENHPRLVDRLAEIRPLWGNHGDVLRQVRDPDSLAAAVRDVGLEMPAMRRELNTESAGPDVRWLQKPFRSSGGHKVRLASPGFHSRSSKHYYQRCLAGITGSAVFCGIGNNCLLLGVSRQIGAPEGDFRYRGSTVDPEWSMETSESLPRLGQALVDRFQLRGLFNVDFIRNADGLWPLEVNPRYSASVEVLERAEGQTFLTLHAQAFDAEFPIHSQWSMVRPPASAFGKAVVYADQNGQVPAEFDGLAAMWNENPLWPGIADLPRVGDRIIRGQPLCTVFAEGRNLKEVERVMSEQIQRIQRLLATDVH